MKMRHLFSVVSVAVLLVGLSAPAASAQSGPVALQGKLDGVGDGERDFTLTIWDAPTGGQAVATAQGTAMVRSGLFTLLVDLPVASFGGQSRWWSVAVHGGAPTERLEVTSVPQAINALALGNEARAEPGMGVILRDPLGSVAHTQVDFTGGYALYRDDNGRGSADSRLWLNTPNGGEIVMGPRGAASRLDDFSVRSRRISLGNVPTIFPTVILEDERLRVNTELEIATSSGFEITFVGDDNPNIRSSKTLFISSPAVAVPVLRITGGSDLAEPFPISPAQPIEPRAGLVLSIDPAHPGALRVSTEAYDTKVAGVYSGGNGLNTGMLMGQDGCDLTADGDGRLPLAMTGRVWVYADDSNGPITPGDRLTTSGINAGYAARVADETRSIGAVIGKAMTAIDPDTGMVLVLVNLQ